MYAVEGYPDLSEELTELFDSFDGGTLVAITSELTLAEVLVQPLMENNLEVEAAYREAVQSSAVLEVVPISRDILVEAARLRSQQTKLKLPDAIHGSTAGLTGCETFLINDRQLKSLAGIEVVILSEVESREWMAHHLFYFIRSTIVE
ncbi:MAG: PIN domain-containing protein [Hormoscilla sp. SP5CHS1]|nr:PIN domain-containing protein [Hormoscilla sp. SP5CHS1]